MASFAIRRRPLRPIGPWPTTRAGTHQLPERYKQRPPDARPLLPGESRRGGMLLARPGSSVPRPGSRFWRLGCRRWAQSGSPLGRSPSAGQEGRCGSVPPRSSSSKGDDRNLPSVTPRPSRLWTRPAGEGRAAHLHPGDCPPPTRWSGPEKEIPRSDRWVTRREQLRLLDRWLGDQGRIDPARKAMLRGDFSQPFGPGGQGGPLSRRGGQKRLWMRRATHDSW